MTTSDENTASTPVNDQKVLFETPQGSPMLVFTLQNDGDEGLKTIAVDLGPLTAFGKRQNLTDDQLNQRLQGFEDAMNLVLMNYNVTPKLAPLSMEQYAKMQKVMAEEIYRKQQVADADKEAGETGSTANVVNETLVEGSDW